MENLKGGSNFMSEEYDYEEDNTDAGLGSDDDINLSEIGEELCQVGNLCCSIPIELYELEDLTQILSLETWNNCLTEEERFGLAEYLPAVDQDAFTCIMEELFNGNNFNFGSPLMKFFNMLKGGLCEPSVALYNQNLNILMKNKHYHTLKNYQNSMVSRLTHAKNAWKKNCNGCGVDERFRVLNSTNPPRSLMFESMEHSGSENDSLRRDEFDDDLWANSMKSCGGNPALYRKNCGKGVLKYTGSKVPLVKEYGLPLHSVARSPSSQHHAKKATIIRFSRLPPVEDRIISAKNRSHQPRKGDGWGIRNKKWKMGEEFQSGGINNTGSKVKPHSSYSPQGNDRVVSSYFRDSTSQKKMKRGFVNKGGDYMQKRRGMVTLTDSSETESESSDQDGIEEDINNSTRTSSFSRDAFAGCHSSLVKSMPDPMEANLYKKRNFNETKHPSKIFNVGKHKGKKRDSRYLDSIPTNMVENGHMLLDYGEKWQPPAKRKARERFDCDHYVLQSNTMHNYSDEENELHVTPKLADDHFVVDRFGKKDHEMPKMPLFGCNSLTKNMKRRERRVKVDFDSLTKSGTSESFVVESERVDAELETSPMKSYTLITPSIQTDFSFSVIHLLSSVRVAMLTPLEEDFSEIGRHMEKSCENMGACTPTRPGKRLPFLTAQEIINRVRLNPGDPCILETQEPLQDLVRGVLKIFSSRTAPLGAEAWKALVSFENSRKVWSWIGPRRSDCNTVIEETSSMAWGLPHKMLVKLVDSFADWLKKEQEALQKIGSLPPPPLMYMKPNADEKERCKDLGAVRNVITISPSSEEAKAHFRKEEYVRYLVPYRAFSYTAADGTKSAVAPVSRFGGKMTSKVREHFMLKPDRPPCFTVLRVVRDAASRLPGGIGTRADVCALIRDSQYIVEHVSDFELNQVTSGALDRLHYELDPCVRYRSDRKLWVYLHKDRDAEEFVDDGTSSTKTCKKPRKPLSEERERRTNEGDDGSMSMSNWVEYR
ncbi:hypothetical protein C5167_044225 [Papaver somniferum]|uniref:DEUBAD domain-containing protein n=1 Tax=Papaver somniferum TaxID=3469 RepID=A0A4Y7L820_PAPSO|nr:uncharacterized protein LOC113316413 [Papaver somniferum]RZC81653.1 hypothetical protein C5167_044225 [Papaver somniferum]